MLGHSPISFSEYQKSLLEKGMAISAACTHESYGGIIFNQIVMTPSCDLLATMRVKALEALSDRFVALTKIMQNHFKLSDENYLAKLVEDFKSEKEHKNINDPDLEWIDSENPRNGIMAKIEKDHLSYFKPRVSPYKIASMRETVSGIVLDEKIARKFREGIEWFLEDWGIDFNDADDSRVSDWSDMVTLDTVVFDYCRASKKHQKDLFDFMYQHLGLVEENLLSPIIDNYKTCLMYVAAEDTAYFSIGRSDFFPIIAGERLDGSHEITIFEACNEI